MPSGIKKHLKRVNAPSHWMLDKMGGAWAPKPTPGPHKGNECLPLCLILRNRLKFALTNRECMQIAMMKKVKIDGKVRTDLNFPCGLMDVVEIPEAGQTFRLLYDIKGRFSLVNIHGSSEAKYKLCKVVRQEFNSKKIPVIVTHDGRTIRYPDPVFKVNDTIKVDIATGKPMTGKNSHIPFKVGQLVQVTTGGNTGRVGTLVHVERHPGSFDIVHIKDSRGTTFATRINNVFVVGNGEKSEVQLPKKRGLTGVKISILEERNMRSKSRK